MLVLASLPPMASQSKRIFDGSRNSSPVQSSNFHTPHSSNLAMHMPTPHHRISPDAMASATRPYAWDMNNPHRNPSPQSIPRAFAHQEPPYPYSSSSYDYASRFNHAYPPYPSTSQPTQRTDPRTAQPHPTPFDDRGRDFRSSSAIPFHHTQYHGDPHPRLYMAPGPSSNDVFSHSAPPPFYPGERSHSTEPPISPVTSVEEVPYKKKRKRADAYQLEVLNGVYNRTAFPSTEERLALAQRLDMTARSVQIWFQNKRQAMKQAQRQSTGGHPRGSHDSVPSTVHHLQTPSQADPTAVRRGRLSLDNEGGRKSSVRRLP